MTPTTGNGATTLTLTTVNIHVVTLTANPQQESLMSDEIIPTSAPAAVPTQILNALSLEVGALKQLWETTFLLKSIRAKLQLLGVSQLPVDTVFPGDISHVTMDRLTAIFSAMDALDAVFLTPGTSGIPPIKAIVDMIP
jgi:hypothetical protein